MSLSFKPGFYLRPKDVGELFELMKRFGERGRIIAGGTGIYEVAHRGLLSQLEALIDISGLGMSYVSAEKETLKIGATTTMSTLIESGEILSRRELSAIADAVKAIQPLQVKNVATVGGAICTSLPFFDLPVALLCLNASVEIQPIASKMLLSKFLKGYFSVDLQEGEFVKQIEVPLAKEGERRTSAFQKFAMTHDDWAIINCGVSLSVDGKGSISRPVIVFGGGVGEKPARAESLESSLEGKNANSNELKRVFEDGVANEIETIADIRASAEYRKRVAAVLGRRTMLSAYARAKK